MSTGTREAGPHTRPITAHMPVERRLFVGDRRATWRGSRRDVDWVKHFEDEALDRRQMSPHAPKTRLPIS